MFAGYPPHESYADSNINIQMNYWFAEMTNMDVVRPLFDYFEVRVRDALPLLHSDSMRYVRQKTWVPRGEYTAKVLYNISEGWVVHDEVSD